jgi:hypothetical protein
VDLDDSGIYSDILCGSLWLSPSCRVHKIFRASTAFKGVCNGVFMVVYLGFCCDFCAFDKHPFLDTAWDRLPYIIYSIF